MLLILIAAQVLLFNLNDETYAIWDQSYYLGDTATSLYTNTLSQYNPYTGKLLDYLNPEYLLETYQNHGAVMCQLLHLHPMVENMTVMASVVIILYQCIMYEIGSLPFSWEPCKEYSYARLSLAAELLQLQPVHGS